MTFAEMKRLKAQYRKATLRLSALKRNSGGSPYEVEEIDRERREVARLEALIREAAT